MNGGSDDGTGGDDDRTQNAQLSLHSFSKGCFLHLATLSLELFSSPWQNTASLSSHGGGGIGGGETGGDRGGGGSDGGSGDHGGCDGGRGVSGGCGGSDGGCGGSGGCGGDGGCGGWLHVGGEGGITPTKLNMKLRPPFWCELVGVLVPGMIEATPTVKQPVFA